MHSSDFEVDGNYYRAHHNGDFSGDVIIELRQEQIGATGSGGATVCVPFDLLKAIVAAWVRSELIARLEDASDDDLLLNTSRS